MVLQSVCIRAVCVPGRVYVEACINGSRRHRERPDEVTRLRSNYGVLSNSDSGSERSDNQPD